MTICPSVGWRPEGEDESYSDSLVEVSTFGLALGLILILGGIGSVIPQHIKLIKKKTSEGINCAWIEMVTFNQFISAFGATCLKVPQFLACREVGVVECSQSVMSVIQLMALFFMCYPLIFIVLKYFPLEEKRSNPKRFSLFIIFYIALTLFVVVAIAYLIIMVHEEGPCGRILRTTGGVIGIFSLGVNLVQMAPQIWKTFKAKSVGSFSIPMLMVQAPGALLLTYFQVFIQKDSIFVWISVFSNAIQQSILLSLLVFYNFKNGSKSDSVGVDDESAPLFKVKETEKA